MNSALTKFLQLAADAGLLAAISSECLDSQPMCIEDPRDVLMDQRHEIYPEQASENQLHNPNMVEDLFRSRTGKFKRKKRS